MKKLIAISVMLALIAGAVFAETSISGGVETRFHISGNGKHEESGDWKDDDPSMGGKIAEAKIALSGSNDDGTLGGKLRFNTDQSTKKFWTGVKVDEVSWDQVYVWWKPIDQVKIFLGIDQDGLFDTADFVGWGFHKGDNDYLFNHHWDLWRQIFPGNWDGFGLAFSFYLVEGLDINLVLATGSVGYPQGHQSSVMQENPISDTKKDSDDKTHSGMLPGRIELVANYSLDFGKISFVYKGASITAEKGDALGHQFKLPGAGVGGTDLEYGEFYIEDNNSGTVGASVLVTAIDGVQIKAGGSIILNDKLDNIINAGLGATWAGEGFGVNARFGFITQGKKGGAFNKDGEAVAHNFITLNVMPIINVGDSGQLLIDIGITNDNSYYLNYEGKDGSGLGWSVTPAYRLSLPGGAFKVGLQVYNNVKLSGSAALSTDEYVKWNIPLSLSFSF